MGHGSSVTWTVRVDQPATYNVQVVYDPFGYTEDGPRPYVVAIGDQSLLGNVITESKGSDELRAFEMKLNRFDEGQYNRFHRKKRQWLAQHPGKLGLVEVFVVEDLGNLTLQPGAYNLVLRAHEDLPRTAPLFNFRTIYLVPVK
jgi:hypothetical protein